MRPGDALFCRVGDRSREQKFDILKAFITDHGVFEQPSPSPSGAAANSDNVEAPNLWDRMVDGTQQLLGDRDLRRPWLPQRELDNDRNTLIGGTAFERCKGRCDSNLQGKRCYSNAISTETGACIVAPCSNLAGAEDEGLLLRKRLNMVCSQSGEEQTSCQTDLLF